MNTDWWDYVSWNPANQPEEAAINECVQCSKEYLEIDLIVIDNAIYCEDCANNKVVYRIPNYCVWMPQIEIPF